MTNILVTGGDGQLAKCIKDIELSSPDISFFYANSKVLDVTNAESVKDFFINKSFDFCVNCAAYTAVDKAENDKNEALKVNLNGAENLAKACVLNNIVLIHISTDFVFDGKKSFAYKEEDRTNPMGVYGLTKLKGEQIIEKLCKNFFIIRTSWLYSEYGNNFMKTMLRLSNEKKELSVVDDQIGTPTYAVDLAQIILRIIKTGNKNYGIYNFSNEGVASWYDFAKAIFDEIKNPIKLHPIKSESYPTPAKRPQFSVLDKSKIKENFKTNIPYWRDSLKKAIKNYNG